MVKKEKLIYTKSNKYIISSFKSQIAPEKLQNIVSLKLELCWKLARANFFPTVPASF